MWSFGVTAWEILTEGDIPYCELTTDSEVVSYVNGGGKLKREDLAISCNNALWDIIMSCWSQTPDVRPTFQRLVILLPTTMGDSMPTASSQVHLCLILSSEMEHFVLSVSM